ncbi:hypothetical protein [Palleronia sp. LCG004]|uniref:hypothetical protein n=1 Tax=Palleronia sp. LCG004 TaxID=3079304 RepID=UPI002941CD76|nr:hypothetical protein [Palleronia sp. LCG004]WOI55751.1 hypothetical protein RVY76_12000 [Palleronia sp. LCG004]
MTKDDAKGPIAAEEKPEGGQTKFDKPSKGMDDFATDEMRDKPIRGPEGHAEDDED